MNTVDKLALALGIDAQFKNETTKGLYESDIEMAKQMLIEMEIPADEAVKQLEKAQEYANNAIKLEEENDIAMLVCTNLLAAGISEDEVIKYAEYLNSNTYKLIEEVVQKTFVDSALNMMDRLDALAMSMGIINDNRTLN